MQVKKNKVNYTEVKVMMDLEEVQNVLAIHIRDTKNVEVNPADIDFVVHTKDDLSLVEGIVATVLKRGRVQKEDNGEVVEKRRPGRPKKVKEEVEEIEESKKRGRKPIKFTQNAVEPDDDDSDE